MARGREACEPSIANGLTDLASLPCDFAYESSAMAPASPTSFPFHVDPDADVAKWAYDGPEGALPNVVHKWLPEQLHAMDAENRSILAGAAHGQLPTLDHLPMHRFGAVGAMRNSGEVGRTIVSLGRGTKLRGPATENIAEELGWKAATGRDPKAFQKLKQMAEGKLEQYRGHDINATHQLFLAHRIADLASMLVQGAAQKDTLLFILTLARSYAKSPQDALALLRAGAQCPTKAVQSKAGELLKQFETAATKVVE